MFCIILQGLPGSGKSTLAKIIASIPDVIVCSADDYFVNKATGVYQWDKSKLYDAHMACTKKFCDIVKQKQYNVIVDNTNCSIRDYVYYRKFAQDNGYQTTVVEVKTNLTDKELSERNIHKVPIETISRMRQRLNG